MPSPIEWTGSTWNPVTGCDKISPGCAHCYAERQTRRLMAMPHTREKYRNGFEVTTHEAELDRPLKWRKPRLVFVCSMSDLFHEDVPDEFIERVFYTMRATPQHTYQVLTKRSRRALNMSHALDWPPNVWLGATVEGPNYRYRSTHLRLSAAPLRFLSLEPLLKPLPHLHLRHIDQVIVGGESGPGARPMKEEWVIDIRDQCIATDTPFFFKQWGGVQKKKAGRELDGRTWDEMPAGFKMRTVGERL